MTAPPAPSAGPRSATGRTPEARSQAYGAIGSGFRIVSIATLLSRILGLARDVAMAALFGAGPLMDAFTVAFRVPNLVRRLLGEGALTAAFLPVFVREHEREGPDGANRLMTAGTLALGGTLLALVLFTELILAGLGLTLPLGDEGGLLILLTAQMLPYAVLICVAAHFSAVLQSLGRFAWPALLPIILNVVWIAAIAAVPGFIVDSAVRIQWVAASVVFAGMCQLAVIWIAMRGAGVRFTRDWQPATPMVGEVVRAMIPVILATSVTQLNSLVDSLLAWGLAAPPAGTASVGFAWPLESGTASALYFAQRMYQFPLGVFGAALGTVLLPLLSRHTERGELEQVGRDLTLGIKLTMAIGLPASVGLILLREPIAATLFERGAFTGDDSALTARCIAAYGLGVCPSIGLLIIHRGFFVLGDRRTPVKFALQAVGLNVVCNLSLLWVFAGAGLALATSIAAMFQFVATAAAYQRATRRLNLSDIARATTRTAIATALMGIACAAVLAGMPHAVTLAGRLGTLLAPLAAATGTYLLTARLIGLNEPFLLLRRDPADSP
ncbi:MAG: murein biosynthesis integral membrane protein MurJ [Planctomycetaceae bacterium]